MVALPSVAAALASAALLAQLSLARSVQRNPVSRIWLVDDAVIKSPSQRVHAHSTFDLSFTLTPDSDSDGHDGPRQKIRLAVAPNDDLIHPDFAVTHLAPDGTVRHIEKVARSEHKVYRGDAFIERPGHAGWSKAGWARITVHEDGPRPVFDGAYVIDGDTHHVQTAKQYGKLRRDGDPTVSSSQHPERRRVVVWRNSDILDDVVADERTELKRSVGLDAPLCGADLLDFNRQSPNPLRAMDVRSLLGRQTGGLGNGPGVDVVDSIGSVDDCPKTKKVALVGVATDCTYWDTFQSMSELRSNVINMVQKASALFETTFNISLGIQNLTVSDKVCPENPPESARWNVGCSNRVNISDRLSAFSEWRGRFNDDNSYWSLLTRCATASTVGLAWRGQLCRTGSETNGGGGGGGSGGGDNDGNGGGGDNDGNGGGGQTVAGANVVVGTDTEWQIFAHETGHTFGAVHDCVRDACDRGGAAACCPLSKTECDAQGQFIMNPTSGKTINNFSPCTISTICKGFRQQKVQADCLTQNKNIKTITGSQCGNGIVESGEDCDCGGEQGCRGNRCCDARTCKFSAGSVCDPTNEDCCTGSCQFAAGGTVCRASTGPCDPAEACPGDRASCPADQHRQNGDGCGDGLSCASGQCTSRDLQCRAMSNSAAVANVTRACFDDGCVLSCTTSPSMGMDRCVTFNHNFVDGTPCGAGGRCVNGACKGASTIGEIGRWIRDHKAIFIAVVSVVGGLVVVAIASSVASAIRRRIRRRRRPPPPKALHMASWPSSYSGSQDGQLRRNQSRQWSGSGPAPDMDGHRPPPPPPPPPAAVPDHHQDYYYPYTPPPPPPPEYSEQGLHRHRSMRYA